MAKSTKISAQPLQIDVNGMSIQDLMNLDVNTLNTRTLRAITTRLNSASNKRLNRINKSEFSTLPMIQEINKKGKFSNKGIPMNNRNAIYKNFMRAKSFLTPQGDGRKIGSTIKELQSFTSDVSGRLGVKYTELTEEEKKVFWNSYRRFVGKKIGSRTKRKYGSTQIQRDMMRVLNKKGFTEENQKKVENVSAYIRKKEKEDFFIKKYGLSEQDKSFLEGLDIDAFENKDIDQFIIKRKK